MRNSVKHHDKIAEALELLNEAAVEKKEELYGLIENKYDDIKQLFFDQAEDGLSRINGVKKDLTKKILAEEAKLIGKARHLDKTVRHNPWPYVGAAAFGALVVGVILGKK